MASLSCAGHGVNGPLAVASVSVAPAHASFVQVGNTLQLAATPLSAAGYAVAGQTVTWSSSDPTIATVTAGGLLTAVAPGVATMTALCAGRSGTATIIVQLPVATLIVQQAAATLAAGASLALIVTPDDSNGTALQGIAIAWSSSNTAVATVTPSAGRVTAVAPGTATITATSGGVNATAVITVVGQGLLGSVGSVVIRPANASLEEGPQGFGAPLQMTATLADPNGNTVSGFAVTWSSSDTSVAGVSSTGLLTPNPSVSKSSVVTITATSQGISGTASITVNPAVASVVFTPSSVNLKVGGTQELTATPFDAHGLPMMGVTLAWTNLYANIVRLDRSGDSVRVTAIAPGVAKIWASDLVNPASGMVLITVSVQSSAMRAPSGTTARLTASVPNRAPAAP